MNGPISGSTRCCPTERGAVTRSVPPTSPRAECAPSMAVRIAARVGEKHRFVEAGPHAWRHVAVSTDYGDANR